MRMLLVILAIALLAVVGLMQVGFISLDQTRPGVVQAPTFQADVGSVDLGTTNRTIQVPTIDVERADNTSAR